MEAKRQSRGAQRERKGEPEAAKRAPKGSEREALGPGREPQVPFQKFGSGFREALFGADVHISYVRTHSAKTSEKTSSTSNT